MNAVHGSSNEQEAAKSISLIFGDLDITGDGRVKGSLTAFVDSTTNCVCLTVVWGVLLKFFTHL